jgi:hypothetical protein
MATIKVYGRTSSVPAANRRRRFIAPNNFGRPIALDLAVTVPHLHRRAPVDPSGQYRRGMAPPGTPRCDSQAAISAAGQASCSS